MLVFCPNCHSTKIKKNGHTYYSKQNHRCKCCGRQFVLDNINPKPESLIKLIKKALKERLSLRVICRIFEVSLTWVQTFSHTLWENTPRNLGLSKLIAGRIKKLQVFGIQADGLWSFVQKKKRKRWIWIQSTV